jgi:cysteine-rich repeat protein
MTFFRRSGLFIALAVGLLLGVSMAFGAPAHAQVDAGLKQVGDTVGLSATDPRTIAVRIINVSLGFLGMILLVLVLYAGFLWMTAGGNPDQVEKAKRYLRNAVIGLVIILSAWAITTYVITNLLNATGSGGGGGGSGGGGGGGGLGGGGSGTGFQVNSISPSGDVAIRNVVVRFLFNRDVDAASANTQISVVRTSDGQAVAGSLQVTGSLVSFTPSTPCPAPNADRFCLDGNTAFEARVGGSLRSADGRIISCGGFVPSCRQTFHTGTLVDAQPPTVSIQSPADGQSWNASSVLPIISHVTDDSGVSAVETTVDAALVGRDGPMGSTTTFDGTVTWDPTSATLGSHALQSKAFDIDSNTTQSSQVRVMLRPAHCFNGRQDADETGLDCGGSRCGACSGGTCSSSADCRSGVCSSGVCVEQPVITGMSPGNGRPGTFVTISGYNFGASGSVKFWNGTAFTVVASAPAACTGLTTWSATQVLVEVPAGALTGPIQLTNDTSHLSDASNDANGPRVSDYVVNTTARPGLCAAAPDSGFADVDIALRGTGLGATRGGSDTVKFQDTEPSTYGAWSDREVHVQAPRITPSTYAVKLTSNGIESNTVSFNLMEPVRTNPVLDAVDPTSGPVGTYVTLSGRSFGTTPGLVRFKNLDTGDSGAADVTFPAQCSANWWQDTRITVKVPSSLGSGALTRPTVPGRYEITVDRSGSLSNAVAFQVTAGSAGPGICAVEPIAGPAGVTTTAYGERFGGVQDSVTFQGASTRVNATDIQTWSNTAVTVRVPNTARTGAVKIKLGSVESNGVEFQVRNCNEAPTAICGTNRQCCADGTCTVAGGRCAAGPQTSMYAWQTSTGEIPINPRVVEQCDVASATPLPPSPSPWTGRSGGDAVCLNAAVSLRFTTRIDPTTISNANVIVQKCTGSGADPCSSGTPTPVTGTVTLRAVGTPSEYVYFRAVGGRFDPNSTYRVILRKQIRSNGAHVEMLEDARCGAGNSYCFTFKTGAVGLLCSADRVSVTPAQYRATEVGETITYDAVPLTNSCLVLDDQINWRWYTGRGTSPAETDTRVSITNAVDGAGLVRGEQTGTALGETGSTPALVNAATALIGANNVTGTAQLTINFQPPFITEYFPNCQKACTNAEIWAKFNVNLDRARVDASRIMLWKCANENCDTYSPTAPLTMCPGGVSITQSIPQGRTTPIWNFVHVAPLDPATGCTASLLQPGAYYRVVFRGGTDGFFSQSGLAMDAAHLNHPSGFSWVFRVKTENDGRCTASKVEVEPVEKYETLVGARQLFQGTPVSAPDECSAAGQRLLVDQSMSWNVADTNVAKLVNGRGGSTVDTTSQLDANCNASCLKTGSNGVVGRVANCGNSVIETTDPAYCRHGAVACTVGEAGCLTAQGDVCTLLPVGSKGSEECDLGGSNGVPAGLCSASCLWTGATGPACGNGVLDRGEQCDARQFVCAGGTNDGTVCSADAECAGGRCNGTRGRSGCTAQCLLTGTGSGAGVTSQCGNGSIGYGEACDDGNTADGDGCSSTCLHEGSASVVALCGNGVVEPGETCDKIAGVWPLRCDHNTCLRSGTDQCPAGVPGATACCGNGVVEVGEDCDTTAGGCSNRCLLQGSSVSYSTPSFCGDGLPLGIGEQCEATRPGDGLTDAKQLAETVGRGTADPVTHLMSTDIRATYTSANGTAKYGVRCGNTHEIEDCNAVGTPAANGLTDAGCCMRRPAMVGPQNPLADETNVCRNPLIFGTFDGLMKPESFNNNFFVAEENAGAACPAGQQQVTMNGLQDVPPSGWLARVWWQIKRWMFGAEATASVWCAGPVTGTVSFQEIPVGSTTHTRAMFAPNSALKPNTRYRIIFRGDANLADSNKVGIRNADGVVMNGDAAWNFTTGDRICTANKVTVEDVNPSHPYIFKSAGEDHRFQANVYSLQGGRLVPIVPVTQYAWQWEPWAVQNPPAVLQVQAPSTVVDPALRSSTTTIRSLNRNGSALVFGGIRISRDDVNTPTTLNTRVFGSRVASVQLCVSPWPSASPFYPNVPLFADQEGNGVLATIPSFAAGPYYNFGTFYCLDGESSATSTDDIPSLMVNGATLTAADQAKGVLRQYFLTYDPGAGNALRRDGIGIRILSNPKHLSTLEWYREQNFAGQPEAMTVDGYWRECCARLFARQNVRRLK